MDVSDPSPPAVDFTQEIRFAVVMYGGVSLAVYMHGIAQELLRLVRATAPDPANPRQARRADAELAGSELVYRKLGRLLARGRPIPAEPPPLITTRFVVDVLTGTSAGGINAVYLAKALANDQAMADLERLWVDEGDIGRLINDAQAVADLPVAPADPPRAPLSGDRVYLKLLDALDGMGDDDAPAAPGALSPNVDELDLFVTATDVRGWRTSLAVADARPDERRFATAFQLRYRAIDGDALGGPLILGSARERPLALAPSRNDFLAANNPFLAFVARATSAHQASLQPFRLSDVCRLLAAHPAYRREPWVIAGDPHPAWPRLYPPAYRAAQAGAGTPFFQRDFADGGVLDSKPFSYVLDTIARRSRVRPVTRKLLFVDPAPERFTGADAEAPPDYVENGLTALLTIRGYETIREDLERLERYNRQAAELRAAETAALRYDSDLLELDRATWEQLVAQRRTERELRESPFIDLVKYYGSAWVTYVRQRVLATTTTLGRLLARGAAVEEGTPQHRQLLAAVRAWVGLRFGARNPAAGPTLVHFLLDFDSDWHLRRLRRTLADLDELLDVTSERATRLVKLADRYGQLLGSAPLAGYPPANRGQFDQDLASLRLALGTAYTRLQAGRASLADDHGQGPLAAAIRAYDLPGLLAAIGLDPQLPGDRLEARFALALERPAIASADHTLRAALDQLILQPAAPAAAASALPRSDWEMLDRLLAGLEQPRPTLQGALGELLGACQDEVYRLLGIVEQYDLRPEPRPGAPNSVPASVARYSLLEFERSDRIIYPTTVLSEVGDERDGVEVYRVSPLDASSLIDERAEGSKLAGTALGAFGAFFERKFRVNDLMWGRLDGAERLIAAILPDPGHAALRRQLIAEAHDAILQETFYSAPERQALAPPPGTPRLRRETFLSALRAGRGESRALDNEALAGNLARLSRVFTRLFGAYGEAHPGAQPLARWAGRLLGVGASVIDAALARSLGGVLARQWLPLVYLFALLQIAIGAIFASPSVQTFGMVVGAAALGFHLLVLLARDLIAGRRRWQLIGGALAALAVAIALGAAATLFGLWLAGRLGAQGAAELLARATRPEGFLLGLSAFVAALLVGGLVVAARTRPPAA